jgi:hypothetical protein
LATRTLKEKGRHSLVDTVSVPIKRDRGENWGTEEAVTEYVGDEDDGGLGAVGAGVVGLEPAEAVDDPALPADGVQHRRVLAALGTRHPVHSIGGFGGDGRLDSRGSDNRSGEYLDCEGFGFFSLLSSDFEEKCVRIEVRWGVSSSSREGDRTKKRMVPDFLGFLCLYPPMGKRDVAHACTSRGPGGNPVSSLLMQSVGPGKV